MCDMLTTFQGAELWCVAELRTYGIEVPETLDGEPVDPEHCLCSIDLPAVLEAHSSTWVPSDWHDGFYEVGPDGRTWHAGYDKNKKKGRVVILGRSDGAEPMTLAEIVAARAT